MNEDLTDDNPLKERLSNNINSVISKQEEMEEGITDFSKKDKKMNRLSKIRFGH
jgi:transcription termination factor NusB